MARNPYSPPQAEVDELALPGTGLTPAEAPLASYSERWFARFIDTLTMFLPLIGGGTFLIGSDEPGLEGEFAFLGLAGLLIGVTVLGANILLLHRNGQTVGKKLMKTRIVGMDGRTPSLWRTLLLREVVNIVPQYIVPLYSTADAVAIFFRGERRCLHDYLAGTRVIVDIPGAWVKVITENEPLTEDDLPDLDADD